MNRKMQFSVFLIPILLPLYNHIQLFMHFLPHFLISQEVKFDVVGCYQELVRVENQLMVSLFHCNFLISQVCEFITIDS